MHTVLRRPDFRLLFGALLASMTAESILVLALAIWVKDLTGSDRMAGATLFAVIAPMTLAPLLGWVVDRYRRRPFFVAANLVTAGLLAPLLTVRTAADVWLVYLVAAGYGLSTIALNASLSGLIRTLVPVDLLADANASLQAVRQGLRLGGPLVGAALYAVAGGWALALVGIAGFATAGVVASLLPVVEAAPGTGRSVAPGARRSVAPGEVVAGLRHLAAEPALRRALLGYGAASLVTGFSEALIFAYVERGLDRPAALVGVLFSVQGVGGLVGAFVSPAVVRRVGEIGTLAVGVSLFGAAALTLTYPGLWLAVVALLLAGLSLPLSAVGLTTLVQRRTDPGLLGRVTAASDALISAPRAISVGTGAVLVALLDYRLLFGVVGLVTLTAGSYLWRARRLAAPPTHRHPHIPHPRRPRTTPAPRTGAGARRS